jgi:phospholipase C
MANNPCKAVKYVVVLMFENRSFDNVLGALSGTPAQQTNPDPGVTGQTISNGNQTAPTQYNGSGTSYAATTIPIVDPGEWFGDMAQQILGGTPLPSANPYTNYQQSAATMQGFTLNCVAPGFEDQQAAPAPNVPDVMNYFTPAQLPVTAFLATNYAVCDTWFASVPTQTYPNRAFALCAAPGISSSTPYTALIDDKQYSDEPYDIPSLLSQMDSVLSGTPNWKVYFHDYSIAMGTVPYVNGKAGSKSNVNVATFDTSDYGSTGPTELLKAIPPTFLDDVGATSPTFSVSLPPFSFIEPRYSNNFASFSTGHDSPPPNSNHPGGSGFLEPEVTNSNPPIDVVNGELLLALVYNLLQASGVWDETLLIVTYDEHGGIYDHVPPWPATEPGTINWPSTVSSPPFTTVPSAGYSEDPAANGFTFNVYGCRVPAIIVSPCVAPGLVITSQPGSIPFDHTSIISTVFELFDLATTDVPSLTERDKNAPSLVQFLDSSNDTGLFDGVIPTFLQFSSVSPAPQTLWRVAAGASVLLAEVSEGGDWLSVTSTFNAIGPLIATLQVTVTVNPGTLAAGTYTGQIQISGEIGTAINVPVTLTVAAT